MHGCCIEAPGQLVAEGDAFLAISGDADFDQFVGVERPIGFRDELQRDACVADAYHRLE